jgi:uncharacterized SAM-binding protein YcdF (DUF218 family)
MLAAHQKERITRAALGAAGGFLIAMALVAANMPLLPGSNAQLAALTVSVIGALIAVFVPVRWIAGFAVVGAVLLFWLTFTPLTAERVQSLVRRDPPPESASPPDAVVVLSTNITADGLLDATGTTRLLSALEAMRQTGAPTLVTTRPSHAPDAAFVVAMRDYRRLISLAGDTSRWRVVGPVATTHDEAVATASLLAPPAAHSIIVVTSPIHTRRACAAFENVGFRVTCWPSDERRYALKTFSGLRTRLAATVDWLYERAATIEYRWRGWIR